MSNNILNDISKVYFEQVSESAVPGKPAEKLGAVTSIPKSEQEAARQRTLAKAAAIRKKKGIEEATKAKPDYLDFDGDGNTKESMKKALRDKAKQKVQEAKKPNDGNLANNYPPYDKVTRGDIIAGALGQDQMGGKKKKKSVKEGYSNWRQDLSEVMDDTSNLNSSMNAKVKEKKVNNKIKINPSFNDGMKESVERLGGELLEMVEIDEASLVYGGAKKEPEDKRMLVTKADKTGNTKAWQNYKAGNPSYKAAPHLDEKITSKTSKEKMISDFVHSDDPKFSSDSKKERIRRALGAWYKMHKEATTPTVTPTTTKPDPAAQAKQRQIVSIQKKQTMDRMAQLNKGVPLTSESSEDSARDRAMERGGLGANPRQSYKPNTTPSKKRTPEEIKASNAKVMDTVRQSIIAKYGKGALM